MKNKNDFRLLLSLLVSPLLVVSLLLAGTTVMAEEVPAHYLIAIDTDEAAKETKSFYSNPELQANRAAQAKVKALLDENSRVTARSFSHVPIVTAELTESEVEELKDNALVEAITPEQIFRPALASSSLVIDTPEAYALGFDGTGVAVAVLDTGVDNDHTFLNVVSEACYSNAGGFGGATTLCPGGATSSTDPDSADTDQCTAASGCDHGTHVAGIAAGDGDGATYTGVAKGADIIAIQVFTQFNSGCFPEASPCLGAYTSDIVAGLNRVLALHNDITFTTPISSANLSLGGGLYSDQTSCDTNNATTKTAIDNLRAVGIATIISSGNEFSTNSIASPGCISSAVAVGSTSDADVVENYSNSSSMVDLLAPGSYIDSSIIGDGNFGSKSGTSMATPQVSGSWTVIKEKAPDASVDDVLQALKDTGKSITDSRNGLKFDRIDLDGALNHNNFESVFVSVKDSESSETGDTALVEFSLRQAPSDDVTIPLSIDDPTEGTIGAITEVVITAATWDDPSLNQVTITGVDDAGRDGIVNYKLITGDPTSTDPYYDGLDAGNVADAKLKNLDDEITVKHDFNGDGASDLFAASGGVWRVSYGASTSWDTVNVSSAKLSQLKFGDFNCDQKTDVFSVSGTDWLVSYGATGSWVKIGSSSAPTSQLLVADVDGDACSDIVRMDGSNWYVSKSGAGKWEKLLKSSTPKTKVLAGDLNGDGRDDALYANGSTWRVSYSMNSSWTTLQTSQVTKSSMIIGDISAGAGEDVFWPNGTKWRVSDNGNSAWATLGNSVFDSKLKLADLDGNGQEDVFRISGGHWYVSYNGTAPWTLIGSSGISASNISVD